MAKLILLFFFGFLLLNQSFAQSKNWGGVIFDANNIISDSVKRSPNQEFDKRLPIKPIHKSRNQVEIRFYEREGLSNTTNLTIIILKNKRWQGSQYRESNYPTIQIKKLRLTAPSGFSNVVQMLLQNNLTSLPNQEALKSKMKKFTNTTRGRAEQVMFIYDGYSYTVEFKIKEKIRIYTFDNPETYANFYTDVPELKDYVSIKNIIATELKSK